MAFLLDLLEIFRSVQFVLLGVLINGIIYRFDLVALSGVALEWAEPFFLNRESLVVSDLVVHFGHLGLIGAWQRREMMRGINQVVAGAPRCC
jgi:hypothetical protein